MCRCILAPGAVCSLGCIVAFYGINTVEALERNVDSLVSLAVVKRKLEVMAAAEHLALLQGKGINVVCYLSHRHAGPFADIRAEERINIGRIPGGRLLEVERTGILAVVRLLGIFLKRGVEMALGILFTG